MHRIEARKNPRAAAGIVQAFHRAPDDFVSAPLAAPARPGPILGPVFVLAQRRYRDFGKRSEVGRDVAGDRADCHRARARAATETARGVLVLVVWYRGPAVRARLRTPIAQLVQECDQRQDGDVGVVLRGAVLLDAGRAAVFDPLDQADSAQQAGIFHHLITLPTYHTAALSTDNLAKEYFGDAGMLGYVEGVQRKEIRQGIACVKHQNMAGSDMGDDHKEYFAGEAALKAGGKDNTMNQFG